MDKKEKRNLGALASEAVQCIRRALELHGPGSRGLFWIAIAIYGLQNVALNWQLSILLGRVVLAAQESSLPLLGRALAQFGGIFSSYLVALTFSVYFLFRWQLQSESRIMEQALASQLEVPLAKLGPVGDIISRLENNVPSAAALGGSNLANICSGPLVGLGCCIMIGAIHPLLAIVALSAGLVSLVVEFSLVAANRRDNDEIRRLQGEKAQTLDDAITGGLTVRMFGGQHTMQERLGAVLREIVWTQMRLHGRGMIADGGSALSGWISMAGVAMVGLWLVVRGELDLPRLAQVLSLAPNAPMLVTTLGGSLNFLQSSVSDAQRTFELLDAAPEDGREPGWAAASDPSAPLLEGKGLSFGYEEGKPVLEDVNFAVESGRTLALVGESGSGKTTLLRLILNLYLPQEGELSLRGVPYGKITLGDWRRAIAYVPQNSPLFDGTIADNIALGREGATQEEIEAAARRAYAHDFIASLPEGYNTRVGEGATLISGGQRQRIAIARAILKDAPVLLLDEATSSLDTQSEREVQSALEHLMEGRATVVVAHRLSTIERADTILVMEEGRVVESGSHEELLAADGAYGRMIRAGSIA